ncbi:CRISPR-associated protein, Cse1 family [Actinobacteria bacterium OK074]|nr:CRISPR-associated protein, Cse1 family [Actinobacteria bacterium OK074]
MPFNLVTDPWIPTLDDQGQLTDHSLSTVLLDSDRVLSLALPTPTMTPAVLRQLLLPVVLHALGIPQSPEEWQQRFEQGEFSQEERGKLSTYLLKHQAAFDLFSPDRPFAQVAALEATSGETKSVSLLLPAVATGNNVPLFSTLSEADSLELTPAQAALWLLHTHCWDTAAIKTGAVGDPQVKAGKTTGNPTGPLGQLGVIVPVGNTLYETLVLNQPYWADGLPPGDRPQWDASPSESPPKSGELDPRTSQWSVRPARGLLDLMTWQSRRIRLIPTETLQGTRVTRVVVAAGDRLEATPEYEPHTAWTRTVKPKAGQRHQRPRRHFSGRTAWQGLGALLALVLPTEGDGPYTSLLLRQIGELDAMGYLASDYPLRVETYGMEYGNQSAVVENAITDDLPLPVAALAAENSDVRNALLEAVGQADRLGRALDRMLMDLRRAAGGEPLTRDKGSRPSQVLLHRLDPDVRRLLGQLRAAGDDFERVDVEMAHWEDVAWKAADAAAGQQLTLAPPSTFGGRVTKEGTYRAAVARRGFLRTLYATLPRAAEAHRAAAERRSNEVTSA